MPAPAPPRESLSIELTDEAATAALGSAFAPALRPGDTLLLRGGLGAGKTVFARALIRAILGAPEAQVPSPSYTIINIYESAAGPIWHIDLYRLAGSAEEMEELGLDEAFETAISLIEWPERLGAAEPERHVEIAFSVMPDGTRHAGIATRGTGWERVSAVLDEACP